MQYETTIEREITDLFDNDIVINYPIVVEYSYYRGCRGARDSCGGKAGAGPQLEPDEPPSIEIEGVIDQSGNEVNLTEAEETRILEELYEICNDDYDGD